MQRGFVVLCRSPIARDRFSVYAVMAEFEDAAIQAVRAVEPDCDLEVNGDPLSDLTVQALKLQPDEARRL
jgi:hypothetical protein